MIASPESSLFLCDFLKTYELSDFERDLARAKTEAQVGKTGIMSEIHIDNGDDSILVGSVNIRANVTPAAISIFFAGHKIETSATELRDHYNYCFDLET